KVSCHKQADCKSIDRMVDVHAPEIRSKNMRAIRSKNTLPELQVRRILHAEGYRYRLHMKNLPGSPDLVLKKHAAVVYVHSCFFHGHHKCDLFRLPKTRTAFWRDKIASNRARDFLNIAAIQEKKWRVAVIWECSLKGRNKLATDVVKTTLSEFLLGNRSFIEIEGTNGSMLSIEVDRQNNQGRLVTS